MLIVFDCSSVCWSISVWVRIMKSSSWPAPLLILCRCRSSAVISSWAWATISLEAADASTLPTAVVPMIFFRTVW